jgi:hypothetical protein
MRLSQPVLVWQDDALRLDFPYARSLAKPRPGYIQSGLLEGIDDFERFDRRKSRSAEINSVTPCSTQRIRTLVSIACDALSPVHQVKQLIAVQQVNTGCSLASQPGSRKVVGQ